FKMPAKNTTVEVTFKKVIYTITVSGTSNGTASVSRTTASIGDQITVTTNPAHGYELNSIKFNGTAINGNTFTMPAANVTVTVNFKRKDAPALGTTATVGNFIYKVTYAASDGTGIVTLTGVSTKTAAVSIPATVDINGYTYIVNRIGPNAFKNDKTIKTLYITANIRFIDNCAFYGCSNLVKVSGGAKLEIIGQSAFINCTKLKTFVITSSVLKKIGPSAFYKDKALKTIYVKNTVKLTKSGVKKSLKGSKVKTVKVKKSKVKAYKKIFKKSNSGRKVKVKK
nr:leucine-rich repeat protein [Saccharofermentans sp.]